MVGATTTLWGNRFQGAPTFDRWIALQLHRWGVMGGLTRSWLEANIREGMQVADVGANQGIFTLLMSRLAGPSGHVVALEPDPGLAAALRRNLSANGAANVTLIEAGADAASGAATLYHSSHNAGDNRMARGELAESSGTRVRVVRMDDVVPDRRLDVVKIDTQGWEMNVFEGMADLISANPSLKMLFEFWPHGLKQAGRRPEDLIAMLIDRGFVLHTLRGQAVDRASLPAFLAGLGGKRYTDLVAIRPENRSHHS